MAVIGEVSVIQKSRYSDMGETTRSGKREREREIERGQKYNVGN